MSEPNKDAARERAREVAHEALERGDATGWFERLYAEARGDEAHIPWADLEGHPVLVDWLSRGRVDGHKRKTLVVGCGLGEDSEALSRAGFEVVAFDISPTAVEWCRHRFPDSRVRYDEADLLHPPEEWTGTFSFVFECYTLQALPPDLRRRAMESIASFVGPRGELLVITRAREPEEDPGALPWPLTRAELRTFEELGLREMSFEDLPNSGPADRPSRHFRVLYRRRDLA